jgi:phage terminase small subunit
MRGRKPKPTILKLLTGNPGKRPLNNNEPEPILINGAVVPPKYLEGAALEEWNVQSAYLTSNRILGENELSLLANYCYLHGEFVKDAECRRIMNAALIGQMRALRAELGIGPSVRSKFVSGKPKEPQNSWEALK